jgi:hypothetical protein
MKKKMLFTAFVLLNIVSLAQNDYSRGFQNGYKEGYCYNDFGCISPIPPITPIPLIGESNDNYQDGYNRGFKLGLEDKQAKKSNSGNTRNSQNTYGTQPYVSTYVSPNFDAIIQAGATMQARYDKNIAYRDDLIKWVFDLKKQSSDKKFLDELDSDYKKLKAMDGEDFGQLGNDLRTIKNNIEYEIDNANTRAKESSNKLFENENNNCSPYLYSTNLVSNTTSDFRCLFSTKTYTDRAKIITELPENAVLYVIEKSYDNDIFYLVCYNGIKGYISKYRLVKD